MNIRSIWMGIRSLFGKRRAEAELDKELQFHVDMQTQVNVEKGMDPEEARRVAMRDFGGMEKFKEESREAWGLRLIFDFWRDIRFGLRQLRKQKIYSLISVVTLALGIGAGTAVFSLINAILLNRLPVEDPHELRILYWEGNDSQMRSISSDVYEQSSPRHKSNSFSYPMYSAFRDSVKGKADIFAYSPVNSTMVQVGDTVIPSNGMIVSDNFFTALRTRAKVGRLFEPETDLITDPSIVLSYSFWSKNFAADLGALGQFVSISGKRYSIIGVLPHLFEGIQPGDTRDYYIEYTTAEPFLWRTLTDRNHWFARIMGRIDPSVSDSQIEAALTTVFKPDAEEMMDEPEVLLEPGEAGAQFHKTAYRTPLMLMFAIIGLVLLVACANLAGLALTRGASRTHEYAIRAAVGSNRWRLARQSLAESFTLAIIGGGFGLLVATWGKGVIAAMLVGSDFDLSYDAALDGRVLLFSGLVTFLTAMLFGLLPALRTGSVDPQEGLRSRESVSPPGLKVGRWLVSFQICVSLAIVMGAGLYTRSLVNALKIDAGFGTEDILLLRVDPKSAGIASEERVAFYERAQQELQNIPGVNKAAVISYAPLGGRYSKGGFSFQPQLETQTETYWVERFTVGNNFFDTYGIRILRGRGFESSDNQESPKVIVVNQAFVDEFLPDKDPLDYSIGRIWARNWRIVGVCSDAKYRNIKDEIMPTAYFPYRQRLYGRYLENVMGSGAFALKSELPVETLLKDVRSVLSGIHSLVVPFEIRTQEQLRLNNLAQDRLLAIACGALGGLALFLSFIGTYGMMAYQVTRRKTEIAIRMAVGAKRSAVVNSVLRQAFKVSTIGIALGLPLAYAAAKTVGPQLFNVDATNPIQFALVAILFLGIAIFAAWEPAVRSTRKRPLSALRDE